MRVIGLTGGIATGKSTVARLLRARGVAIIDADQVARAVVAPGTDGLHAIIDRFGAGILDSTGGLDRAKLRKQIAYDAVARQALEQITHPRIANDIAAQLERLRSEGVSVAVVEAALMIETGSYRRYDAVIVVSCATEVQLSRLMARDRMTEADAKALVMAQMPLAEKRKFATWVIENNDGQEALVQEVARCWTALLSSLQ